MACSFPIQKSMVKGPFSDMHEWIAEFILVDVRLKEEVKVDHRDDEFSRKSN